MSDKKWCPTCEFRTKHVRGKCQECEADNGPLEKELEEAGQQTFDSLFDNPGEQIVS